MFADVVVYLRDLWGRPSIKLLLGSLTFGTAFTNGFVSEMGYGLFALISEVKLLVVVAFYTASTWLVVRLIQLGITASRAFVVLGMEGLRDMLKWFWPLRWLLFWPLRLRFKLRRHVWLYYLVVWALILGLVVVGLARFSAEYTESRIPLAHLGALAFEISAMLILGAISLGLYALREIKGGRIPVLPGQEESLRRARAPSAGRLRLAHETFFVPLILILLFNAAGTFGKFNVSLVRYAPPSVMLTFNDGKTVSGSILMASERGLIYFPADTRIGTFVPADSIARVEALEGDADQSGSRT